LTDPFSAHGLPYQAKKLLGDRVYVGVRLNTGNDLKKAFSRGSAGTKRSHFLQEFSLHLHTFNDNGVDRRPIAHRTDAGKYSQPQKQSGHILSQPSAARRKRDCSTLPIAPQGNSPVRGPKVAQEESHLPITQRENFLRNPLFTGALPEDPQFPQPFPQPFGMPTIAVTGKHKLVPIAISCVFSDFYAELLSCGRRYDCTILRSGGSVAKRLVRQGSFRLR
jgi:hypothetical protein